LDRNWFGEAGRKVPINPEGFVPLKELVIYLLEIKNGKDKAYSRAHGTHRDRD
jgi:hypothetical protein